MKQMEIVLYENYNDKKRSFTQERTNSNRKDVLTSSL